MYLNIYLDTQLEMMLVKDRGSLMTEHYGEQKIVILSSRWDHG